MRLRQGIVNGLVAIALLGGCATGKNINHVVGKEIVSENVNKNKITLDNLNDHLTHEIEGNRVETYGLKITNYDKVKPVFDSLYKKITGENLDVRVKVVSKEYMQERKQRAVNYIANELPDALTKRGEKDSIFVLSNEFKRINNLISHEIGHTSTRPRYKNFLDLGGYVVEEAKAMAFTGAWNEALTSYLPLKKGEDKFFVFLGMPKPKKRKEVPVYVCAYDLVRMLETEKGSYTDAYNFIVNNDNETILNLLENHFTYQRLKKGEVKSTTYLTRRLF